MDDRVVPFGRPPETPASNDSFAEKLGQASAQALKKGATAAVLVFFSGDRTIEQISVDCPDPMARGMIAEAHDYWGSATAGARE